MTTPPPRRSLALHLPDFATDRLRRAEPDLPRHRPLATWGLCGSRRLLAAVDAAASEAGLQPGQVLADAQAIAPDLLLRPMAPEADAAALHSLALWARRYTPLAAAEPPNGLILNITGCVHLLGGERALLSDALARLAQAGFAAHGAVAALLPLPRRSPVPGGTIQWRSPASRRPWPRPCRSARRCGYQKRS